MNGPFRAGRVGRVALIGLSLALGAHLWMQFDEHPLSEVTPMEEAGAGGSHSGPRSAPVTHGVAADMAALCLAVISGFAIGSRGTKPRRAPLQFHLVPPSTTAYDQVLLRHPPWVPRSLFARSVSLLH